MAAREVSLAGDAVTLTAREFELLVWLMTHPRQVFTREELLERCGASRMGDQSTVTFTSGACDRRSRSDPTSLLGSRQCGASVIASIPRMPHEQAGSDSRRSAGRLAHRVGRRRPGMPATEAAQLAIYAAVAAIVAGALGSLALRVLSHRSMGLQIGIVSLTSVAAVAAGAVSAANQMFISSHDLRALAVVLSAAGAVGATGALVLGRRVSRASRWLGASAGLIAEGRAPVDPSHPVSEELRSVALALKDMSQRLDQSRERERAMERSRRELVAWVSHDLRTPSPVSAPWGGARGRDGLG